MVCCSLFGCAGLKHPNWESVNEASTAYKQPCKEMGVDECNKIGCESDAAWFKKRATTDGANNFIIEYAEDNGMLKTAKYFYCGTGISIYMHKSGIAWTIRNKINPNATEVDYKKANTECDYEAHKATIDTSRPAPSRVFIPTNNFSINMVQINARDNDSIDNLIHDTHLDMERITLKNECLIARGYITTKSTNKKDLAEVDKYCPDLDSALSPCFILGIK